MKIDKSTPNQQKPASKKTTGAGSAQKSQRNQGNGNIDFASLLAVQNTGSDIEVENESASVGDINSPASAPLSPINPISTLEAIDDNTQITKTDAQQRQAEEKAYQKGQEMMMDMQNLQMEILGDGISQETLMSMQDHIKEQDKNFLQLTNEDLKKTLQAIELRTKVELAKIKRARS